MTPIEVTHLPPRDAAELFRTHRVPMARLAYVLTGRAAIADEVVQDAFLRVHSNWTRIDNPVGYLRTAVVNGCNSFHRRNALERRTEPLQPSGPIDDQSEPTEIAEALATLSPRQRTVLALRYFADLSDADIAAAIGARPSTVRSLIRRGLAEIRKEIEA